LTLTPISPTPIFIPEDSMNVPADLFYTESHEWVRRASDGTLAVGITDHAQAALGDLVYVELPVVGRKLKARDAAAIVESVKAASDVYAPVAGEVIAVNDALTGSPEQVNADPYGAWLFRLKPDDASAVEALLDPDAYVASVGNA
jgi:glycine cleavage system H protein